MNYTIETEQEDDGRWIAEVMELPGVIVYGHTRDDAIQRAEVLALRLVADRLEHGEDRDLETTPCTIDEMNLLADEAEEMISQREAHEP